MTSNKMVKARPPSPPTREQLKKALIVRLLADGVKHTTIAKQIGKSAEEQKRWRRTIRDWAAKDLEFQRMMALEVQGILWMELGPTARALTKRASRGRPDAIKLMWEAMGFHNPRVKHDHSGEVKIKLEIPRPIRTEDVIDGDVVDADVVD